MLVKDLYQFGKVGKWSVQAVNLIDDDGFYNAGFDIADNLENVSQKELRNKFAIISQNRATNINITDKIVKTQELAKNRGDIKYRAIVKVNYNFETRDED